MNPLERFKKVVVVGQGYVGLPVAMRAVEVGFNEVVGFELDADRVKRLNAGESFVEDVPSSTLLEARARGTYRATADLAELAGFDIAIISVPTPLLEGAPDLSYIEAAARDLGAHLTEGACVVLESTTYPGTTEELVAPILEEVSGLSSDQFHLGYSPERIDPGNPTWTFVNTPKVVSGRGPAALEAITAFYSSLVDEVVPVSSPKEAELTKLLENTFRHVNIALVNELAMFANDLGIDIGEAIDAAATKPFGYMRFTPGPGVGGHCLPIDPSYLSWRVRRSLGHTFRFVELANDINDHMPDYVVRRLVVGLNRRGLPVRGRRILVVGFAYKRNTGDARETPARAIVRLLRDLGADVAIVDPHVDEHQLPAGVERVELTMGQVEVADAVLVLVDHDDVDTTVLRHATYVLDCCRSVSGSSIEKL